MGSPSKYGVRQVIFREHIRQIAPLRKNGS